MRSRVLRSVVEEAVDHPESAGDRLARALAEAQGPLVEPVPGRPDTVLVTFVVGQRPEQPFVSCQLFPGYPAETPMLRVKGLSDVWWAETTARRDVATVYQFQDRAVPEPTGASRHEPQTVREYLRELHDASSADPFNPRRCYPITALALDPGVHEPVPVGKWHSVVRLPDAVHPLGAAPARAVGDVSHRRIRSAVLGNSRDLTIWSPPGPVEPDRPVVVLLDGESFLHGMDAPVAFDRLLTDGAVRPFTGVLVHNPAPGSRLEEYRCDASFERFFVEELLPQVRPGSGDIVVGGFSLGGLAACGLALSRSELVDGVLALSPSLWWTPDDEPEWLTRQFGIRGAGRTRFWLEVGELETETVSFRGHASSMVEVSRRFRDVLVDRRTRVAGYHERAGGHDFVNWRRGLEAGLAGLLGPGAPVQAPVVEVRGCAATESRDPATNAGHQT